MRLFFGASFQLLFILPVICLPLFALEACSQATPGDKKALRRVDQQWGDKYKFKLSQEIYWTARARPNVSPDEQELRSALETFTAGRQLKDSAFTYLNVYDAKGRFVFQLYRDAHGKIVKELKSEHY